MFGTRYLTVGSSVFVGFGSVTEFTTPNSEFAADRFGLSSTTPPPCHRQSRRCKPSKRQDAKASYQARENRRRWVAKNPSRRDWIHSAKLQGHRCKKWTSA